ncbi:phage baseplate upper protein [Lentilactobacillus kefiri]|uniref:phage baseplate upper protein n=1 Tax=Lentilactobacillus kefiri TaxID=33962 RepID=UPI001FB9BB1B|nr:phage baseplate upper protein [Lentilactobacillus kefiri]MCJ2161947.1 phage baseplate upper protein [Lentilactobacillus kefiri]
MSKELAFTDDNDVVKYLDTTTAFNLALTADGVAFDLTNAKSILVKIANDDGYIMQEAIDLTAVTSPLGGTLSFPINQDIMNTLVPDDYDIEVWVTMNDGTQAIFPSDGTLGFSIEENLMSDTGEVIPTITLNDFQQQFDDLSSQMENAVHNVHKGDQGNPGNGIKSANNQYQLSDSPVTVPTGGWSDTILATTDQLPYLWTKIIFIYDDGTTKEINFVSSRGDTGSQGPIGPVGPQGKQGNGLVVRGKADKKENLPTMGNNQGDGYLVGTDLYIWIDGSWQNMGSITPDLTDYVKVTDMNNALNAKVNVTDMRKPASDVAGIEEVNAKQDKIGYTPADDSKVVHNSSNDAILYGNNNIFNLSTKLSSQDDIFKITQEGLFQAINTAPANNPWGVGNPISGDCISLWWSFIFVDDNGEVYVETPNTQKWDRKVSENGTNNFHGKNTFDIAPIDKTTGHPYITKDGVPAVSDTLADTTKDANFMGKLQKSGIDVATTTDVKNAVNTATANMVDTTKPANFTAGLQSGGVSVATSDDLKSVEASAWRQLDNKYITPESGYTLSPSTHILYKIDNSIHTLYLSGVMAITDSSASQVQITVELGSIFKQMKAYFVPYLGYKDDFDRWQFNWADQADTHLTFRTVSGLLCIASTSGTNGLLANVTYDELV